VLRRRAGRHLPRRRGRGRRPLVKVTVMVEQLRRPIPGGIGTYARGLMQGLTQMGADAPDLDVHASRQANRLSGKQDAVTALGWPVRASPLPSLVLTRAWDRGLVRAPGGADVVHATSLSVPGSGGPPLTVMVHDLAWRTVPDAYTGRGRRWHEAALGRARRRAAAFVTPSAATAEGLVAAGVAADRVVVIEEGCDHLPIADHDAARSVLASLGVTTPYLLTVSTLEPRKNLDRLLAAYRRAVDRLPEPWPLVVVGPAGWGPTLAPVPGSVLAGAVPAAVLAALYAGARCLAYVPLVEGYGLPPVEAMHAAAPVVASPMPSTAGAALEVDPLDVDAIADALVLASTDDLTRRRLVQAGTARAAELRWERAARSHVELWQRVA
jgi:glycosyltransferase involved in cell wall biosynthesis